MYSQGRKVLTSENLTLDVSQLQVHSFFSMMKSIQWLRQSIKSVKGCSYFNQKFCIESYRKMWKLKQKVIHPTMNDHTEHFWCFSNYLISRCNLFLPKKVWDSEKDKRVDCQIDKQSKERSGGVAPLWEAVAAFKRLRFSATSGHSHLPKRTGNLEKKRKKGKEGCFKFFGHPGQYFSALLKHTFCA